MSVPPKAFSGRGWLRNVTSGYADTLVSGALFLLLTPLMVDRLGAAAYALWVLGQTVTLYLAFLDLGFGNAQVRFHALFVARGRTQRLRDTIATSCAAMLVAGTLAALIGISVAVTLPTNWFHIEANRVAEFRLVMGLLAIQTLVAFASSAIENIYEGASRFDLRNLRSIGLRVATAATQAIALLNGAGLVQVVAIELGATAVGLAVDLFVTSRLVPLWWRGATQLRGSLWRRLRNFALWTSLDEVLTEGGAHLDHLVIVVAFPLVLLTPYSICTSVAGLLLVAVRPVAETLFPIASALHGSARRADLPQLLLMASKGSIAIAAPIALFLGLFGQRLLELWVPDIAPEVPSGLMTVVVLDYLTSMYLWPATLILLAIGRTRLAVGLTAAELITGVVLMIVLAPFLGLLGIALASLIANVSLGLFVQLPFTARAIGVEVSSFFTSTLPRVSVALVPSLVSAVLLRSFVESGGWVALIAAGVLFGALYGVCLLLFGTRRSERDLYLRLMRQR